MEACGMSIRAETSETGVLNLTFDRPEKKNAFTLAMYEALVEHLDAAARDDRVRVVALRGAGSAFSAGNDLFDFMSAPPSSPSESAVIRFLLALVDFEKPILAGVRGPAVGVGTTLLLHCDAVYAAPSSRFSMPFVALGLVPEGGSSLLLPRLAGLQKASEWLMFAEPFDADQAQQAGLVNQVVPEADLDDHLSERADTLAQKPRGAVADAKNLLRGPHRPQVREAILREAERFLERLSSPEAQEAFTAFFEKRPPDFRRVEADMKKR
jgi:enoyl-CoA hydratase/carnithine racemase